MLLSAPGLVLEQHDRRGARFGAAIDPHIRLALRAASILLQHLDGGFVTMDELLRQQFGMHGLVCAVKLALTVN